MEKAANLKVSEKILKQITHFVQIAIFFSQKFSWSCVLSTKGTAQLIKVRVTLSNKRQKSCMCFAILQLDVMYYIKHDAHYFFFLNLM